MVNYPDHNEIVLWPDISNYQPYINGALVKAQGYGAISFKISEGLGYIDQTANEHHAQAVNNGLVPMAYHFLRKGNGSAQADRAASLIQGIHGSYAGIGFMLDVERPANGEVVTIQDVNDFASRWRQLNTGIPLGIYSGGWYWSGYMGNPKSPADWNIASGYNYGGVGAAPADPWWIIEVPAGGVTPHYIPSAWGGVTFQARQFTDAGIVGGVAPCDVNIFWGNLSAFKAMVTGGTVNPPVPPKPCPPVHPNRFLGCPVIKLGAQDRSGFNPSKAYAPKDWPVHALQHSLNVLSNRGLVEDGNFGPATDKAVRDYQTMCMGGVHNPSIVDGVVGAKTWGSLDGLLWLKGK